MVNLFGKKEENDYLESPKETLGFSKELASAFQDFIIKKFDFLDLSQIDEIKTQLKNRRILIINAKEILEGGKIKLLELKQVIDELKTFLRSLGGSIGRIGDNYMILTPNSQVRIAN
ncbi:MAG: DUF552 domain-containing protein [Candidatus Lokiarchaeota archaeon]|nr:DUF552 domain-containing protein [Candidatus Lokiarchaeota archaeon]